MKKSMPWPPVVGDTVGIKDSVVTGTVIQTKGVYEARFRLMVSSDATGLGREAVAERRTAKRASRWYGLDELEPRS